MACELTFLLKAVASGAPKFLWPKGCLIILISLVVSTQTQPIYIYLLHTGIATAFT